MSRGWWRSIETGKSYRSLDSVVREKAAAGERLMPASTLAVLGVGLVSGVGLTAEESCAAIRCGINNFQETRFIGSDGDWLVGSAVELEEPWRGITKLAKMAARAIGECFAAASDESPSTFQSCCASPSLSGRDGSKVCRTCCCRTSSTSLDFGCIRTRG